MKTRFFAILLCAAILLISVCGCGSAITEDTQSSSQEIAATSSSDDPEHLVYDNKYPSHPLYYSVKEDFPEYFYLWPTMNFGRTISDELARYDIYGDVSVKTEKSQYGVDSEVIQAEVFFPNSGYRDDVQQVGYLKSLGLEKLIDGEWTPVAFKGNSESYYDVFYENYRYIDVKSIPSEGKTIKMELKTECLYEPLSAGRYRVILFLDDITCRYAEFECAGTENITTETTVESTEETISKTVAATIEEQIKPGQTYSEVREIIGFDGTDVGYGAILYEWKTEGGGNLLIWFVKPNTEDAVFPDDLIVQNFRMNSIK